VLAVCHLEGTDDMYYYSTTFSGGPGVCAIFQVVLTKPAHPFRSGAFDAPKAKCPPDRGSPNWVTDGSASFFPFITDSPASSPSSSPPSCTSPISHSPYHLSRFHGKHASTSTSPRSIPSRNSSFTSTPALTPDDGSDYSNSSGSFVENVKEDDALDFLMTLFPHHGLSALPYSRSVTISAPNMGVEFHGVVLTVPGKPKTLYVDGKSAQSVNLRERLESFVVILSYQLTLDVVLRLSLILRTRHWVAAL
jgi:hypothetical protein